MTSGVSFESMKAAAIRPASPRSVVIARLPPAARRSGDAKWRPSDRPAGGASTTRSPSERPLTTSTTSPLAVPSCSSRSLALSPSTVNTLVTCP